MMLVVQLPLKWFIDITILKTLTKKEFFENCKEARPDGSGVFIKTEKLITDVQARGLNSDWGRVKYNDMEKSIQTLKQFLNVDMPVIVCQQYTKEQKQYGHFRVVFKVDDKDIFFHDPHPKTGGEEIAWSHEKFMDFWQPSGKEVIGGIYIWIEKKN